MAKAKKTSGVISDVIVTVAGPVEYSGVQEFVQNTDGSISFLAKKPRSSKWQRRTILAHDVISIDQNGDAHDITVRGEVPYEATGVVEHLDNGFVQVTNEEGEVTLFNGTNAKVEIVAEEDGEASSKKAPAKGGKKPSKKAEEEEEAEDEEAEDEEDEKPAKKGAAKGKKAAAPKKGGKKKGAKWG